MSTNLSIKRNSHPIKENELESLAASNSDISLELNEIGGILCLWVNKNTQNAFELQYYDNRLETVQTPNNSEIQKMFELASKLEADIIDEFGDIWDTQTSEVIGDTSETLGAFVKVVFIVVLLISLYWWFQ